MKKVIFDLDGTLIDSRERLYRLFVHLVPQSTMTFSQYWSLKREGQGHEQILRRLGFSEKSFQKFSKTWHLLIEDPNYLAYDRLFPGVLELLEKLRTAKFQVYLLTARQNESLVHKQLEEMRINHVFTEVMVTQQRFTKEELLREKVLPGGDELTMVGDTGLDIMAGKAVGARTVAVLSGFRSERMLKEYKPDSIVKDVSSLLELI